MTHFDLPLSTVNSSMIVFMYVGLSIRQMYVGLSIQQIVALIPGDTGIVCDITFYQGFIISYCLVLLFVYSVTGFMRSLIFSIGVTVLRFHRVKIQ